jgi:hypothetical protein
VKQILRVADGCKYFAALALQINIEFHDANLRTVRFESRIGLLLFVSARRKSAVVREDKWNCCELR